MMLFLLPGRLMEFWVVGLVHEPTVGQMRVEQVLHISHPKFCCSRPEVQTCDFLFPVSLSSNSVPPLPILSRFKNTNKPHPAHLTIKCHFLVLSFHLCISDLTAIKTLKGRFMQKGEVGSVNWLTHTCTHQNGKAALRGNGDAAVADLHQPVRHNTEFSTDMNIIIFCSVKPGNTQLLFLIQY